jgi:hypothetical protein
VNLVKSKFYTFTKTGTMKNQFLNLIFGLILLIFTSCGLSMDPQPSKETIIADKAIIGETVKIGNLEVAQFDFNEKMSYVDALGACERLGDGWKLPNIDELNILYQNMEQVGNFEGERYWSSQRLYRNSVYFKNFLDGSQDYDNTSSEHSVRAVRPF